MQLRRARLCLDCEEIHEDQRCPVCASETFAYLTRWIPSPERRTQPRPAKPTPALPARPSRGKMLGLGVAGVGLFGLAQWLAKGRKWIEETGERNVGELK
ncbi:MAG TPA: hypothetical protein VL693_20130 [Vicinamibacterales bacterium]|jgi:hypothetical protein|nr:hypothetical protein [Vicinamibacterales bacterium]